MGENPQDTIERIFIGTAGVSVWDWRSCHLKTELKWASPPSPGPGSSAAGTTNIKSHRIKSITEVPGGQIIVEYSDLYSGSSTTATHLQNPRDFSRSSDTGSTGGDELPGSSVAFNSVIKDLMHVIGVSGSNVFFLDKRLGICSVKFLDGKPPGFRHVNHCFIPSDWCNRHGSLRIQVIGERDILFLKTVEVAVVKDAVKFEDERREVFEEPVVGRDMAKKLQM